MSKGKECIAGMPQSPRVIMALDCVLLIIISLNPSMALATGTPDSTNEDQRDRGIFLVIGLFLGALLVAVCVLSGYCNELSNKVVRYRRTVKTLTGELERLQPIEGVMTARSLSRPSAAVSKSNESMVYVRASDPQVKQASLHSILKSVSYKPPILQPAIHQLLSAKPSTSSQGSSFKTPPESRSSSRATLIEDESQESQTEESTQGSSERLAAGKEISEPHLVTDTWPMRDEFLTPVHLRGCNARLHQTPPTSAEKLKFLHQQARSNAKSPKYSRSRIGLKRKLDMKAFSSPPSERNRKNDQQVNSESPN